MCRSCGITCTFGAERQGSCSRTFWTRKMHSWRNSLAVCAQTHSQTHSDGFGRSSRSRGSISRRSRVREVWVGYEGQKGCLAGQLCPAPWTVEKCYPDFQRTSRSRHDEFGSVSGRKQQDNFPKNPFPRSRSPRNAIPVAQLEKYKS